MGYDKGSVLKTGALAVGLGVAAWLLAPIVLPANLPQDFPKLPDLQKLNPSLRELLKSAAFLDALEGGQDPLHRVHRPQRSKHPSIYIC